MDPYLEYPANWSDFHATFIVCVDYAVPPPVKVTDEVLTWIGGCVQRIAP
jgi:hypothetical protein